MTMCKTIPTFILLLTGYCVKNMRVAAAESENKSTSMLPDSYTPEASQQPTTSSYISDSDSGKYDSTAESSASILVVGLSIFFVVIFICVVIGVWNARKLSKQDSFDITSAPSGEA